MPKKPNDIFKSNFRFPKHVTILAPGPNGKDQWSNIEPDSFVIAVNYGVLIPARIDAWCVADWWAIKTPWFLNGCKKHTGLRFFSRGLHKKTPTQNCDYIFNFVPKFTPGDYYPVPHKFKPDGTIVGITIEMAAQFGAELITICGADMSGNTYYDGGESKSETCPHGDIWAYVPYLNSLIKYYQDRGVLFDSLSETKLAVN